MRKALFMSVLVGALTYAAPATAGCWATVELSPRPSKITRGTTWTAHLTVLQHGRNPLPDAADARPIVTIENGAGRRRTFTAQPVDPAKGTYAARVVFPSGGTWTYKVFDDFTSAGGEPVPCSRTHEVYPGGSMPLPPPEGVALTPPAASDDGDGFPVWPVTGGLGAALLLVGGLVFLAVRMRRTAVA